MQSNQSGISAELVEKIIDFSKNPDSTVTMSEAVAIVASYPEVLTIRDESNSQIRNTLLLNAINANLTRAAEMFIDADKRGQMLSLRDHYQTGQNTPLLLALKKGNIEIAKLLINSITNAKQLEIPDHFGFTPMLWAAILRADDVIALLMEKGVDPARQITVTLVSDKKTTSAQALYMKPISPDELLFPPGGDRGDSREFCGAMESMYSDLHWHIKDILKNMFSIDEDDIDIWMRGTRVYRGNEEMRQAVLSCLPAEVKEGDFPWIAERDRSRLKEICGPNAFVEVVAHFGVVNEAAKIEFAFLRNMLKPDPTLFNRSTLDDIEVARVARVARDARWQAVNQYQQAFNSGSYLQMAAEACQQMLTAKQAGAESKLFLSQPGADSETTDAQFSYQNIWMEPDSKRTSSFYEMHEKYATAMSREKKRVTDEKGPGARPVAASDLDEDSRGKTADVKGAGFHSLAEPEGKSGVPSGNLSVLQEINDAFAREIKEYHETKDFQEIRVINNIAIKYVELRKEQKFNCIGEFLGYILQEAGGLRKSEYKLETFAKGSGLADVLETFAVQWQQRTNSVLEGSMENKWSGLKHEKKR